MSVCEMLWLKMLMLEPPCFLEDVSRIYCASRAHVMSPRVPLFRHFLLRHAGDWPRVISQRALITTLVGDRTPG